MIKEKYIPSLLSQQIKGITTIDDGSINENEP